MFRFAVLLSGMAFLYACQDSEPITKEVIEIEEIQAEVPEEDLFDYATLKGIYVGDFGGSDIRIVLNYVSKTNAVGYNIHKGLQRNLSGKVERSGDSIKVYMAEPGDHEFDGVFELLFIGEESEPQGVWNSNSGIISPKSFELKRVNTKDKIEWSETPKITFETLHFHFSDAYDTLGEYSFKQDGLVIFSYYPGGYWSNESEVERSQKQMKEIQGTWSMDDDVVTVAWEPNKILPKPKMSYKVQTGEYEASLFWEGNPIHMRMYP